MTVLPRRFLVASFALGLLTAAVPGAVAAPKHSARNATVRNPKDRTEIAITIFKPAAAAGRRVPVIFHSHGWAGSRETEVEGYVKPFLDAGFGSRASINEVMATAVVRRTYRTPPRRPRTCKP